MPQNIVYELRYVAPLFDTFFYASKKRIILESQQTVLKQWWLKQKSNLIIIQTVGKDQVARDSCCRLLNNR